jgi:polar amino acid transport system substrate-binding protein
VSGTTTAAGGGGGNRTLLVVSAVILVGVIAAAALWLSQGGASPSPSPAPSAAPTEAATAAPTATPEPTPTPAPTPTPNACAPGNLATLAAGALTIGTDNPAYPPYFAIREGGNTPPWEDLGFTGDPTTGEGFESAVAYAVAKQLGFADTQVSWVVVPFANAIAPGPKQYDFVINQVSFSTERAAAVDLTDGYYDLNQAVVALKDNPAAGAKSIADLKPYRFGAQTGTTSYTAIENVINPDPETQVFNDNASAVQALQSKLIDVLVVDLPTADFVTRVQVVDADFNPLATIVGQLAPAGGVQEYFSLALNKDSALTSCLNEALAALREDGTLDKLASTWLPFQEDVPVLP